jgi:GT2 family glycosyltransferase
MSYTEKICAVVVTYNRKDVLRRCVELLVNQTRPLDKILIVDNASSDGTEEMVGNYLRQYSIVEYQNLGANLGGGGGFYHGSRLAFDQGYNWVWLMDDDCFASEDCLKNLITGAKNIKHVYSPIVLSVEDKKTVLWGIKATPNKGNIELTTLPFNGFFIHRKSLEEIGFPDKNFFIYGDDADFNMRARAKGKKVIMVTDSIMYHPFKNMVKGFKVHKMFLNKLWAYYKLRNALIIYKRYGYISIKQLIMLTAAAFFYLMTFNFTLLGFWMEGLKDGLNGRLYVKESLM